MLYGMTMNMQPVASWSTSDIMLLFLMWGIMMAGMMLPSALPVILLVERINRQRQQRQASYTPTMFFAGGYLLIWTLYSLAITLLQWWLHHLDLLTAMMVSENKLFIGTVLIAAGIYQFTPLKQRCLQLCRAPLSVISSSWSEGYYGAIKLGIKHGQYCVGCCWFLMALLFVTGVMNLQWILILSLIVLAEKTLPRGKLISNLLGLVLILLALSYFSGPSIQAILIPI